MSLLPDDGSAPAVMPNGSEPWRWPSYLGECPVRFAKEERGGRPRKPRLRPAFDTLQRGIFLHIMDRCHGSAEWALAALSKVTGLDSGSIERRIAHEDMRAGGGVVSDDWTPAWRPDIRQAEKLDHQIEGLRKLRRALFARCMTIAAFRAWPLSSSYARFGRPKDNIDESS